jgi:hypothetical protein
MLHNMLFTYCWEVKYPVNGKLYFSGDRSMRKEITNLKICGRQFVHKYSDIGTFGTPFDGVTICEAPGYFFITFDGNKFYIIEVSVIDRFMRSKVKYLDEETCSKISYGIGELGKKLSRKFYV